MTKIAYLTIDEFPSQDGKKKIDYLDSKNIPAILFSRGEFLEKRPKDALYAINKGYVLGNHSYSHVNFEEVSLEKAYEEMETTDDLIDEIYERSDLKRPGKVFRFPYLNRGGSKERVKELQDYLKDLGYRKPEFKEINYRWYKDEGLDGYIDVDCTYDTMDYSVFEEEPLFGIDSLEKVLERIDEDVPEGRRGLNYPDSNEIIMIHDFPFSDRKLANKIFFQTIEKLLTKALRFELPAFR